MTQNIGKTDRIIRATAGVVVILAGFIIQSWWGAIGLVPLATSLLGFCPLYTILGISTNVCNNVSSKPSKNAARLS